MKILIAAATSFELEPFMSALASVGTEAPHEFHICVTGIGMMHTAGNLTKAIVSFGPDIAIQAGIAGAFKRELALGTVVMVDSECQGDLGIEDKDVYIDIFEAGLSGLNEFPYTEGRLINTSDNIFSVEDLPRVKGLTVNTVSGSTASISLRSDKYECDVESMEGAAFHYVCLTEGIPFLQVRAISNYVEPRDKSKWKIKEAIANLNDYLIEVLLKTKHGAI